MFGEPDGGAFEGGDVVGAGAVVAAGPALDLPADVAFGPPQVAESGGIDVDGVEFDQGVDEGVGDGGHAFGGRGHGRRHRGPQDHPLHTFHHVKRRADHVRVRAVQGRARGLRIDGMEAVQNPVFPFHVVGRLDGGAEGGAAEHPVPRAQAEEVRQVRKAAGKLFHDQWAVGVGEAGAEVGVEAVHVERLAGPHGAGPVDPVGGGHGHRRRP